MSSQKKTKNTALTPSRDRKRFAVYVVIKISIA